MTRSHPSNFLRTALFADAALSGAAGLLMASLSGELSALLVVPAALLRGAGLSLLPFAAVLVWLATRERAPRAAVLAVIVYNALWAADSILLLFSGWIAPNTLGYAFIIAQATAVALFAELQFFGLKKSAAAAA